MSIITDSRRSKRRGTQRLRNVQIAMAVLGSLLCLDPARAAESTPDKRPMLQVPLTDSKPVVDGKLDEPFWKDAARTGPLGVTQGEPSKSTTEAFILRDADHLYVGVICTGKEAAEGIGRGHTSSFTPGRIPEYAKRDRRVQIRRQVTAFLGVSLTDREDHVTISGVVAGGPAEQGGIKPGDRLTKLGDQSVRTAYEVIEWVRARSPGDRAKVSVTRGGKQIELPIKLTKRPE